MKGQRNRLIGKMRMENPDIIDVGCMCHLANLAVGASLKRVLVNVKISLLNVLNPSTGEIMNQVIRCIPMN